MRNGFGLIVGVLLGLGGCQGQVLGDGAAPSGGPGGGGSATGGSAGSTGIEATGPDPVARLSKLTATAFANSLRDVLGSDIPLTSVEQDLDRDGFYSVGSSSVAISPAGISQYEAAIDAATAHVFASDARALQTVSCVPQSTTDLACAETALAQLGRRAFRRPLSDVEVARFKDLFVSIGNEAGSVLEGLRYAVSAILQSPSFLYRVELGTVSQADGARLKYTSFEMASRLSAVLWNSLPDDDLLDAAARDELGNSEGVRAQAERLLLTEKSHAALASFFDDYYDLEHLRHAVKDPQLFPTWSTTLAASMEQELQLRLSDMVFGQRGDFLSLYDGRGTFLNNELARHYGLPEAATDTFRAVELPADSVRVGLLGSGAFLAGYALPQRTSATQRGKFVVETLLCKVVPPPPPTVVVNLDETSDPNDLARERLAVHRANPTCAACHALMDPVGLSLENFDSIGSFRTQDKGKTIDASGDLDGAMFTDAVGLASALRNHPDASSCVVRKLYTNAQGRELLAVDELALSGLTQKFGEQGNRIDRLLVELVTSEAFRFVQPVRR